MSLLCQSVKHFHRKKIWFYIHLGHAVKIIEIVSEAQVWDLREGQILYSLQGHEGPTLCAEFSPTGEYFASGSADEHVRVAINIKYTEFVKLRWPVNDCNTEEFWIVECLIHMLTSQSRFSVLLNCPCCWAYLYGNWCLNTLVSGDALANQFWRLNMYTTRYVGSLNPIVRVYR